MLSKLFFLIDFSFINVVARFPGSSHDAFIFDNSSVPQELGLNGGLLLGDSAYRLTPSMMTPFQRVTTAAEGRYNHAHAKTRGYIERTFGLWKSRFR